MEDDPSKASARFAMNEKIVKIEKVVFGGKGLSRDLDKVTFVPFTLPGESVKIRIKKEHPDYQEAEAIEIMQPSPDRVAPECVYFGICGGCQLSHATYNKQVLLKTEMLREALQRNRIQFPEIEVITSKPFEYRYRAQLKYDAVHRALGFYQMGTNRVVDIQECMCLSPGLNGVLKSLRSQVCTQSISSLREIECYENDQNETAFFFHPASAKPVSESTDLTISFRGFRFPMDPNIFLQVNPGMWRAMIQEVESHYPKTATQNALELYCGAGFFTAPLASRFRHITACEENPKAIAYAKSQHGVRNVTWVCSRVEAFQFPSDFQILIVDPPRTGLPQKVLNQTIERKPEMITYVSCDCTTFSRDLKKLKEFYSAKRLTILDLFPQTYHFEIIAFLERL